MIINDLSRNYYLIGNEIFVEIESIGTDYLEVDVINISTPTNTYNAPFRLFPINNIYRFNLSVLIRGLFPYPEHLTLPLNTMQTFQLDFKTYFEGLLREELTVTKEFIRGYEYQRLDNTWNLANGTILTSIANQTYRWEGVEFPSPNKPYVIQNDTILQSVDAEVIRLRPKTCNGVYIRFLNRYGGYQYWYFPYVEYEDKSKPDKYIRETPLILSKPHHKELGNEVISSFEVKDKIDAKYYDVIRDLIYSFDVYEYKGDDVIGITVDERFKRLRIENNTIKKNNIENTIEVKLNFSYMNDYIKNTYSW